MGRCAVLEGVNIFLNASNRDLVVSSALSKEVWVVDSLSSTGDLFTSHEEVIRVCIVGVLRVDHSIERSSIGRVAVEHIEVSVELLLHDFTKSLLVSSIQVLKRVLLESSFLKKLYTVLEVKADILALELLKRILIIDNGKFLSIPGLKSIEDVNEHF